MTNATDFLLGGAGKSAKFEAIGDSISGTITASPEVRQQTDLATGKPKTWDDGHPIYQLVVSLQTTQRDPDDPDDDGVRNLYVKGSKKAGSKSLHDAVAQAVRSSGARGLEIGGTLTVKFVGERAPETRGFNPAKQYEATYTPPSNAAFLGTDDAAPAPAEQPAASAPAPDAVATAKQLISAGLDDGTIVTSTGLAPAVVAALRNAA